MKSAPTSLALDNREADRSTVEQKFQTKKLDGGLGRKNEDADSDAKEALCSGVAEPNTHTL